MTKVRLFKLSRKVHKWTGLILGIQVLLWILGGVVMSIIPRDLVVGDHLAEREALEPQHKLQHSHSIDNLLKQVTGQVESIHLTHRMGAAAYQVNTSDGQLWFDGKSGERLELLSEQEVRNLAQRYYKGEGELASLQLLNELPLEMRRRKTPMWQVIFDDAVSTTFYITPENGRLVRVRSAIWRFYDFFWMLHIMDYDERSDTHNPLLVTFSLLATLFALSGMILLFQVFKKRDFLKRKREALTPVKT